MYYIFFDHFASETKVFWDIPDPRGPGDPRVLLHAPLPPVGLQDEDQALPERHGAGPHRPGQQL